MKFHTTKKITLRLYKFYIKAHFRKIILALFLSFGVGAKSELYKLLSLFVTVLIIYPLIYIKWYYFEGKK